MTVVIGGGEDDDLPDALTEIPPPLTGGDDGGPGRRPRDIDPKIRRRRIDVGRALGRKRLWLLVGIAGVVIAVIGPLAVLTSSLFDIERISVTGTDATTDEQLAPILEELRGEPILTADLNAAIRQLEALPYVKDAAISTDFPHDVSIDIEERVPLAVYAGDDGAWHSIDRDARALAEFEKVPSGLIPIVTAHRGVEAGQLAPAELRPVALLILSIPEELAAWVDTVNVTPTGETQVTLRSGAVIAFGRPDDRPQAKVAVALQQLRVLGPTKVASLDVTDPTNVKSVVK